MVIDNLERYFLIVVLGQFFVSTKLRFDHLEECILITAIAFYARLFRIW